LKYFLPLFYSKLRNIIFLTLTFVFLKNASDNLYYDSNTYNQPFYYLWYVYTFFLTMPLTLLTVLLSHRYPIIIYVLYICLLYHSDIFLLILPLPVRTMCLIVPRPAYLYFSYPLYHVAASLNQPFNLFYPSLPCTNQSVTNTDAANVIPSVLDQYRQY